MNNKTKIRRTHDFDHIFSDLYTNVGGSSLWIKNLERCVAILKEYFNNNDYYIFTFSKIRLLEDDFRQELNYLAEQGINVNKEKYCIYFPKKYIHDKISDLDLSKLKYYFNQLDLSFSDNPLYVNNKYLVDNFRKEYNV